MATENKQLRIARLDPHEQLACDANGFLIANNFSFVKKHQDANIWTFIFSADSKA